MSNTSHQPRDQDQHRHAHGTMLTRLHAADFAVPQPLILADLRAHLALTAARLQLDPAANEPRRADHRAALSILEIAIRAVAGADNAKAASANGNQLTHSFGRFVIADLALLAERGSA